MVICLERSANDLHMVQLMPLPPHHLCFSKIQNHGLSFWYYDWWLALIRWCFTLASSLNMISTFWHSLCFFDDKMQRCKTDPGSWALQLGVSVLIYMTVLCILQQRIAVKSSQFWQQKAKDLTHLVKFHTQILKSSAMVLSALSTRLSCVRAVTSLPLRKSFRTSASRFPALSRVFTARAYALAVYAMVVCLSVCLSVCLCLSQVGVLLKWLNIGTRKQRHTIAQGL